MMQFEVLLVLLELSKQIKMHFPEVVHCHT